jgi:probable F420-dependent oxidoreductase
MRFAFPLAFSEPAHACAMARAADEHGWDFVCVSDHVVHPARIDSVYPYTRDGRPRWESESPWPDPWVTIGAMAAVTSRLRFFTNIFVLPMRNPFLVAKAVGTASVLSGGRAALGIGMGWMREEFGLLEQDFRSRGRRADEMIEVMRKLWTGDMVEHHGEFYDFGPLRMSPGVPGPIPIYVGGFSEPALRRVGRLGDGWVSDIHTVEELRGIVERIRHHRKEHGREGEPLEIVASAKDAFDLDGYRRMAEAGVTTLATMPWLPYGGRTDALEDKLDGIRRFADDVIAKMR